ncbi:aliphatic sulfonate ABC transporter substrate-binding protein [Telmatospirillum siberiense]|uniref:Putative aliphatic sulfonates-binding protein n=1 Tax=Telmatospirillum siberiense TaxID=382514 RepID=A0A2N3Q192_9PROT|nr:aliphatic sulfonate ABC transporter substrate-binding protein [Telmatospirillum siberiense]PKU26426.1 aliphatic sulfonates ABC transporter substrate-binding protein [Telmatospirillum siberiense]
MTITTVPLPEPAQTAYTVRACKNDPVNRHGVGHRMVAGLRAFVLASALLAIPARQALAAGEANAPPTLNVGDVPGGLQTLLRSSGDTPSPRYQLVWYRFREVIDELHALNAGALDLGSIGDSGLITGRATGLAIKAVAAWQTDGANNAIVARAGSPFRSLADLTGHKICVSRASLGHFLLLTAAAREGLPEDALKLVFLGRADCKAALSSGAVDAWAAWGPYTVMEELHNSAQVVLRGSELTTSLGLIVGTEKVLQAKRDVIRDFLDRVARARAWGRTHQEEYARAYAEETGIPFDAALLLIKRDNTRMVPISPELKAALARIQNTFFAANILTTKIDLDEAFDLSFSVSQN